VCRTAILPPAVAFGSLEDILSFKCFDKLVVQLDVVFGGRGLGDGAGDTKLPGGLLLTVHGESRESGLQSRATSGVLRVSRRVVVRGGWEMSVMKDSALPHGDAIFPELQSGK
jgi:hypothetical protein